MSDNRPTSSSSSSVQLPNGLKPLLRGLTREILKAKTTNFEKCGKKQY